jgi:hypothetical protein
MKTMTATRRRTRTADKTQEKKELKRSQNGLTVSRNEATTAASASASAPAANKKKFVVCFALKSYR